VGIEYLMAQEVKEMAEALIPKEHPHLAKATIVYLFRKGDWKSKGATVYGCAEKAPEKWRHISNCDFVITINFDVWNGSLENIRKALLDHELTHCIEVIDNEGFAKWAIQPHVIEDFPSIIRKHGLWTEGLRAMVDAHEAYKQGTLFSAKSTGTEG